MKKRIGVVALLVLLAVLTVQGTFAAYNYTSPKTHNVITSGNIDIDLVEAKNEDGDPFEDIEDAMPGQKYSKIVWVENDGYGDAYVKLEVLVKVTLKDGTVDTVPVEEILTLDYNTKNWEKGADGCYYYKTELDSGDETEPLFKTVQFSSAMDNRYQGGKAVILINAYAVQADNNEPKSGKVTDVVGWPD